MSERWINNNTTASFTMADIESLVARFAKREPIMAYQGPAAQLALAIQAERPPTNPLLWGSVPPDTFLGLDVVEEQGWTYIGTTRQLAEARRRWGSLLAARVATTPHTPAAEPGEGEG